MEELLEILKQARRDKEISLADISEETKIQLRYLEALESADFGKFPGEVYLKGALSSYATAVGLDSKDILERYHRSKGEEPPEKLEPTPLKKAQLPPRPEKGPPLIYGIIVLSLLLFASGYLFVRQHWPKKEPAPPVEQQEEAQSPLKDDKKSEAPEKEEADPPELSSKLIISDKKSSSQETFFSVRHADSLKLELTSSERCWIELYTDEEAEFPPRNLKKNETITAKAKRQIWIRLGHPPGVELKVNGVTVDETGEQSRPHNFLFVLDEK